MRGSQRITELPVFEPDERQQQAIEHVHGPMLVVAGAGSGKTAVLTRRIAHLVAQGHASPSQILALAYTNNAADEMRERVQAELRATSAPPAAPSQKLQAMTFHAYCFEVLARRGKQFGVLDEKDLWIYLRRRLRELHLNYFVRAANVSQFLDDLLDFMRRCQDELVEAEQYAEYVRRLERGELPVPRVSKSKDADTLSEDEVLGRCREICNVFATVERMLQEENFGTFGHMITGAYKLLQEDADLLAEEQRRARFILVDEFQDANFAQIKILQKLAGSEANVFAVGDPDQAIYKFRGASSAAFELFHRDFPNTAVIALGKNRRSTSPILKCAFALISKNPEGFSPSGAMASRRKPLVSAREEEARLRNAPGPGLPVEAVLLEHTAVECTDLARVIRERQRQTRCSWSDFAVLCRMQFHRDEAAAELAEKGIPFAIENMDVMDTPEVRDLLACTGAVVSASDGASLFRVAALPQFAVDPEKLRSRMRSLPRDAGPGALASVLGEIEGGSAVLDQLRQTHEEISRRNARGRGALEIIVERFRLSGKAGPMLALLNFADEWEKKSTTRTKEIAELLDYLEYFREARGTIALPSPREDAVRLLTVHAAKGLEFDHVFILRANSGSFPSYYREPLVEFPRELRDLDSLAEDDDKALHDQEERRLFYVAMTRARDSLAIYARRGRGRKEVLPAGFMRELLKDASLSRWLRPRNARAFQTDLFGQAAAPPATASRTSDWISLPPASDLHARLSATAVERYETCPLQFKLEREWRIPAEVPAAMQYGAAMHRILRTYYDRLRFERPIADDELIELFRADLALAGIQDGYQHELYEKQGVEQLREFVSGARQLPSPHVLHVEEPFEVKIGKATIAGRMDRVDRTGDGRVVITDYKTGKPRPQEDADESLQLSIYALAARENWAYSTDHLVLHNLEGNSSVITRRSESQLAEARRKVEEVAEEIAAGNFKPKTGRHCVFCAYRTLCPATERRVPSPAQTTAQKT